VSLGYIPWIEVLSLLPFSLLLLSLHVVLDILSSLLCRLV